MIFQNKLVMVVHTLTRKLTWNIAEYLVQEAAEEPFLEKGRQGVVNFAFI